jgi:hypothetical protein
VGGGGGGGGGNCFFHNVYGFFSMLSNNFN